MAPHYLTIWGVAVEVMLPICVRTEKVLPKLSSNQGIRGNLVYINSILTKEEWNSIFFSSCRKKVRNCSSVTTLNSLIWKTFWSRQSKITTMCNFVIKKRNLQATYILFKDMKFATKKRMATFRLMHNEVILYLK